MITIDRVLAVVERPDIPAPTIDYGLLMPLIVVFAVAMLGLIVEIVVPRDKRFVSQAVVTVGGLLAGLASTIKLYLDLSEAEVADSLGVPIGTVRSRLFYAMRALRAALDADARPVAREAAQ